jgi:hypothetical protein
MRNGKLIGTQAAHNKKEGRKVVAVPEGELKVTEVFHSFEEDHPVK